MSEFFLHFMKKSYQIKEENIIKKDETIQCISELKTEYKKITLQTELTTKLKEKHPELMVVYSVEDIERKNQQCIRKWLCAIEKKENYYIESYCSIIDHGKQQKKLQFRADMYNEELEFDVTVSGRSNETDLTKSLYEIITEAPEYRLLHLFGEIEISY